MIPYIRILINKCGKNNRNRKSSLLGKIAIVIIVAGEIIDKY